MNDAVTLPSKDKDMKPGANMFDVSSLTYSLVSGTQGFMDSMKSLLNADQFVASNVSLPSTPMGEGVALDRGTALS